MTNQYGPETVVRMVAQGLPLDPLPTETQIDELLTKLATAFGLSPADTLEARRLLHARFTIRMDMGQTLKTDHEPWLDARRGEIEPFYWERYAEFLIRGGWSPPVKATLDRSMNDLLDLLGNPAEKAGWKRRGLVVGDVQSGKTASYAALICKAADAGYRMVVLLTGTLENVRRQTQERLDAAFVGLDSRDFLGKEQLKRKTHVGVGLINGERDGVVFTSRENDFRKTIATALNIPLEAVKEPVLVVSKKNKRVLTSLAAWLRAKNADRDGHIDLPLLLIDDEADNASINTKQNPGETTAINSAIRDLLGLFTRSSYVGFTATPFANIFIDPSSADEMLGDDLFPSDFIHLLEPPTNYVGMNDLFPQADPEDIDGLDRHARALGLRPIDDASLWMPDDHKLDFVPEGPPDSLHAAIGQFLLVCAIRDLRMERTPERADRGFHRSMLVNVSRFTAVQSRVADEIHLILETIRQQVRLYGALPGKVARSKSPTIASLERLFEQEFADCGFGWADVLAALHESISPVRVQAVNQKTGAASLDYGSVVGSPGVRVIAVGGNSLSRGLTLEGLCVSYFLRNSKAYDTLLQMGRWFGYRDGYRDLCRLWISSEAERWYRHIADATAELKHDFARMRRQKATPEEFGLRVRTHPDTLIITARNKMATGVNMVDQVVDISLSGRGIETSRLYADVPRNRENFELVTQFIGRMIESVGPATKSSNGHARLWDGVPSEMIAKLLDDFAIHPQNHDFQGDAISAFLLQAVDRRDPQLSFWSVVLPTDGTGGKVDVPALPEVEVKAKRRRVLVRKTPPMSLLVSGASARVGSLGDVLYGLTSDQIGAITQVERERKPELKEIPADALRAGMSRPLLVLYLLRGFEREGRRKDKGEEKDYKEGLVLPALGLHFPGIKDPNEKIKYVSYRLNRIAQAELELDDDDVADDDDED